MRDDPFEKARQDMERARCQYEAKVNRARHKFETALTQARHELERELARVRTKIQAQRRPPWSGRGSKPAGPTSPSPVSPRNPSHLSGGATAQME